MTGGEGERLDAQRRRKFWRLVSALAAVGAIAGFVFGFIYGGADAAGEPVSDTAKAAAAVTLVVATLAGCYFSWRFFSTVDEVEVSDNLWASLIGFYIYVFGFPTWWALSWLEMAPKPDEWILFAVVMLSTAATYGARKWRTR